MLFKALLLTVCKEILKECDMMELPFNTGNDCILLLAGLSDPVSLLL